MKRAIRVILYGLGNVGTNLGRLVLQKRGMTIVGAIDVAKEKRGKDLGDILKVNMELGIKVSDDAERVLSETDADVVLHATTGKLEEIYQQLEVIIKHRINVITSVSEMYYPQAFAPRLAAKLDKLAKEYGVTVLGSGRLPGFISDAMIYFLTTLLSDVKRIKVFRATSPVGYIGGRVQQEFGLGLKSEDFERLVNMGVITGNVGHRASIMAVGEALGWKFDEVRHSIKPIVKDGQVVGSVSTYSGIIKGEGVFTQEVEIVASEGRESKCVVTFEGVPGFKITMEPYAAGPIGTAAVIVNQIPHVINAEPGLKNSLQMPLTGALLQQDARRFVWRRRREPSYRKG